MKKRIALTVFLAGVLAAVPVFSQNQRDETIMAQLDSKAAALAENLGNALKEANAQNVGVGQFAYRGSASPLGEYWRNQLTQALANVPGRAFAVLAGGAPTEWTVTGEIIEIAGTLRVYTQLIRVNSRDIAAAFHTDMEANIHLVQTIALADFAGGGNSWDNPIHYQIGFSDNPPLVSRMLEPDGADYFLLIPPDDGRLIMETSGDTDTYMEFFDGETERLLAENDDGGTGLNARIRHTVQAGRRYIAMVRGYSSRSSGEYNFFAYFQAQTQFAPDEHEPNDDPESAGLMSVGAPQTHNFHHADDVDWVQFQIEQGGRYTIHARGVNSNRLDTYIELFDANLNLIAEDDDSGEYRDSLLSLALDRGRYYLKVWCLNEEPDQPYTISITQDE